MSEPNDADWLLARERGDDVSHVPAATRAKYERIAGLIKALAGQGPPPGWKQQVLDALDDPSESPGGEAPTSRAPPVGWQPEALHDAATRGRTTWTIAGGTLAAAATALVLVVTVHTSHEGASGPLPPVASVTVRRSDVPHRRNGVSIGDTLVVEARASRSIELRVYGDAGEPLARCNEAAGCTVERTGDDRRFRFELALASPGCVRTVLFIGDSIPPASFDLDSDLEAAERAKVAIQNLSCVHVQ